MNGLSNDLLKLTPHEIQIMQLIAQGKTSREIAEGFGNSRRTIENQRAEIYFKLEAKSAAQAVARCKDIGII